MKFKHVALALLGLALLGCSEGGVNPSNNRSGKFILAEPPSANPVVLKKTVSLDVLIDSVRKGYLTELNTVIDFNANYCENVFQKEFMPRVTAVDAFSSAMPSDSNTATPEASPSPSARFFTETNRQESDVDEADLIKTDGLYTYSIHGEQFKITQIWPLDKFQEKGGLKIEGKPFSLFLIEKSVVLLSKTTTNVTKVTVMNVSDVAAPKIVGESYYTGTLIGERGVGKNIHLVFNTPMASLFLMREIDENLLPKCDGSDTEIKVAAYKKKLEEMREEKRKIIEGFDFSSVWSKGDMESMRSRTAQYYYNNGVLNSMIHVVTLESDKWNQAGHTVLVGTGTSIYASPGALYVANSQWNETQIHRFDLTKHPVYTGSNKLEGRLLNTFAMGEYKDILRVATTNWRQTQVFTLDVKKPSLDVLGKIENIGLNEDLYAVRFIGPKGYVVTFKKIDPLFVLDLADPKNPKVAGELKVPGFSTYLHPVEEGQLIGLGKDGDDRGDFAWFQGIKLSLFDVSNAGQPKELSALVIGGRGSGSEAAYDHHAFTFDLSHRLLAIPVSYFTPTSGGGTFGQFEYNGVHLYKVSSEKGFESVGIFKFNQSNPGEDTPWYRASYADTIRRSILIGDENAEALVTYRNNGIGIHKLDGSLTEAKSVVWSNE